MSMPIFRCNGIVEEWRALQIFDTQYISEVERRRASLLISSKVALPEWWSLPIEWQKFHQFTFFLRWVTLVKFHARNASWNVADSSSKAYNSRVICLKNCLNFKRWDFFFKSVNFIFSSWRGPHNGSNFTSHILSHPFFYFLELGLRPLLSSTKAGASLLRDA